MVKASDVTKELILILGGARSGKSAFAQSLAPRLGRRVTFIATGWAGDEEMRQRIERHRRLRPPNWRTVEAPLVASRAVRDEAARADVVLLDCLTLLVSNLMAEAEASDAAFADVNAEIRALIEAYGEGRSHLLVVSNEVGLGVVPAYASGRTYQDLLGLANQTLAQAADRVYWMVAGLPVEIKASGLAALEEASHGLA